MTATETELERQVRDEQKAYDEAEGDPGDETPDTDQEPESECETDDTTQTEAFDPSQYEREDLQIPLIDGQTIDRIEIKFTGSIFLDRSEPADVKVYNELRFGRDVAMLVEAKCVGVGAKGATNREGDLDVVIGSKGLKIHTLRKPAGADWVEDAAA